MIGWGEVGRGGEGRGGCLLASFLERREMEMKGIAYKGGGERREGRRGDEGHKERESSVVKDR